MIVIPGEWLASEVDLCGILVRVCQRRIKIYRLIFFKFNRIVEQCVYNFYRGDLYIGCKTVIYFNYIVFRGVTSVSFPAHGSCIYTAGADGMICELDSLTGNLLRKFKASSKAISSMSVSSGMYENFSYF